jgi:hypothetical protein
MMMTMVVMMTIRSDNWNCDDKDVDHMFQSKILVPVTRK